jgi:DMSO/TMAO reductase YedYZ heme-binding membrane subunit
MSDVLAHQRPDGQITRDDIESKLREVYSGASEQVASTKNTAVTIAGVIGLILLLITFLLGVRGGKKKTTIVEIRRV